MVKKSKAKAMSAGAGAGAGHGAQKKKKKKMMQPARAAMNTAGKTAVQTRAKANRRERIHLDWNVPAPPHLNARPVLAKTKHKSYFEFAENLDKKKKRLEFEVTDTRRPPINFTFVPVGNPELSNACKELSREEGALIYVVSSTREASARVGEHVHRIGYHFRTPIVERAAELMGATPFVDSHGREYYALAPIDTIPDSQEDINKQADAAIRDLFPRIPNTDREMIIAHAFQKGGTFGGKPMVGLAPDIPLSRRVQLATIAHIRHTHTRYDELLREATWEDCRKTVESLCLDILVKWRGDEETGRDQLDEVLREVVIISESESTDEDDSDAEGDDEDSSDDESSEAEASDSSIEEVAVFSPMTRSVPSFTAARLPKGLPNLRSPVTTETELEHTRATHVRLRGRTRPVKQDRKTKRATAWEAAIARNRRQLDNSGLPAEPSNSLHASNLVQQSNRVYEGTPIEPKRPSGRMAAHLHDQPSNKRKLSRRFDIDDPINGSGSTGLRPPSNQRTSYNNGDIRRHVNDRPRSRDDVAAEPSRTSHRSARQYPRDRVIPSVEPNDYGGPPDPPAMERQDEDPRYAEVKYVHGQANTSYGRREQPIYIDAYDRHADQRHAVSLRNHDGRGDTIGNPRHIDESTVDERYKPHSHAVDADMHSHHLRPADPGPRIVRVMRRIPHTVGMSTRSSTFASQDGVHSQTYHNPPPMQGNDGFASPQRRRERDVAEMRARQYPTPSGMRERVVPTSFPLTSSTSSYAQNHYAQSDAGHMSAFQPSLVSLAQSSALQGSSAVGGEPYSLQDHIPLQPHQRVVVVPSAHCQRREDDHQPQMQNERFAYDHATEAHGYPYPAIVPHSGTRDPYSQTYATRESRQQQYFVIPD